MNIKYLNWPALIGGIIILLLIPISIYTPWWHLEIGSNLLTVNASPVNTNLSLMNNPINAPLIWAANLTGILFFLACGITLLIYAIIPAKPYSQELLSFGYRKPLYTVIVFLACILIASFAMQAALGVSFPLSGTSTLSLPSNWTGGTSVSALVTSTLQWPFYLAIAAVALCIVARVYHIRITKSAKQTLQAT
jgi:hypothetical protein